MRQLRRDHHLPWTAHMAGSHDDLITKLDFRKTRKQKAHPHQKSSKTSTKHQRYQMQTATEGKAWCSSSTNCSPSFRTKWNENQLRIINAIINPVTATITKHSDTQKERLNVHKLEKNIGKSNVAPTCNAVKARNAMDANLTQKLKPQHQTWKLRSLELRDDERWEYSKEVVSPSLLINTGGVSPCVHVALI